MKLAPPIPPSRSGKPRRTRALWRVDTCEIFLDLRRAQVIERIEDARLAWAFDLAAPGSRRRLLRILAACALEAAGQPTGLPKHTADLAFDEVLALIIPHQRPDLRGTELQRRLNLKHQAISQLHRRRALKIAVRAAAADGPNSSHKFTRASVVEFLRKRVIA